MRDEYAAKETAAPHVEHEFQGALDGFRPETVEFHSGITLRRLDVLFDVRMNADPCRRMNALILQNRQLIESRLGEPGVRSDRQARFEMCNAGRANQLCIDIRERLRINADLNRTGAAPPPRPCEIDQSCSCGSVIPISSGAI